MITAVRQTVRPLIKEPFYSLRQYSGSWDATSLYERTRIIEWELVPEKYYNEFEERFLTKFMPQAQTQSFRRLMNFSRTKNYSPLRDLYEFRGRKKDKTGSQNPAYGTLQVLDTFVGIMRAPSEEQLRSLKNSAPLDYQFAQLHATRLARNLLHQTCDKRQYPLQIFWRNTFDRLRTLRGQLDRHIRPCSVYCR